MGADHRGDPPSFELKEPVPGRGFDRLPPPDPGDIFFDMEGDPYHEGGLEYLFGLWFEEAGEPVFRAVWAHDRDEERAALAEVMEFFTGRLRRFPNAHIYHYAAYEVMALRPLVALHGLGEAALDQMLREERFVDLYAVVRYLRGVSRSWRDGSRHEPKRGAHDHRNANRPRRSARVRGGGRRRQR